MSNKSFTTTVVAKGDLGYPVTMCGSGLTEAINAFVREVNSINKVLSIAKGRHGEIRPTSRKTWDECIVHYPELSKTLLWYDCVSTKSTHTVTVA